MNVLLKRYSGSASAFAMTGYGPKPTLAPPDDNGNAGAGDGDGDDDAGDDDGGDKSGAGGDGKGGDSRVAKAGGLFSKRGNGGTDDKAGADDEDDKGTEADGRPKGLAEKFWDPKTKAIKADALAKSYADLEKAHGELKRNKGPGGGEVPETADGYFGEGIKVPEKAENFKGIGADDPGVKSWAEVCKARGIGKDLASGLLSDMLVAMNDHAPTPIDPDEEMKALGKGGPSLVDGLFVWVEGMEKAGDLSESDIDVIEGMMMTADGARLLAKFRAMSGEKPIPIDPGGGVRGMSLDALEEQYREAIKKGDLKEQQRLDELRDRINPDGASA